MLQTWVQRDFCLRGLSCSHTHTYSHCDTLTLLISNKGRYYAKGIGWGTDRYLHRHRYSRHITKCASPWACARSYHSDIDTDSFSSSLFPHFSPNVLNLLHPKFQDTYFRCLRGPENQFLHRDGLWDDETTTVGLHFGEAYKCERCCFAFSARLSARWRLESTHHLPQFRHLQQT